MACRTGGCCTQRQPPTFKAMWEGQVPTLDRVGEGTGLQRPCDRWDLNPCATGQCSGFEKGVRSPDLCA